MVRVSTVSSTVHQGHHNRLFQLSEDKSIFRLGHQTRGRKALSEVLVHSFFVNVLMPNEPGSDAIYTCTCLKMSVLCSTMLLV